MHWKHLFFCLYAGFFPKVTVSTIIVLGDSILAPQSTLVFHLAQNLSMPSTEFQNFATIGSSIETGSVISIPQQYQKFQQVSLLSSPYPLIMDGGGNDIFSHRWSCQWFDSSCQRLLQTLKIQLQDLFEQFSIDQYFSSVVYLGYYEIQGFEKVIDEGMTILAEVCRNDSSPPCCLVDPRSLTIPKAWDGIHPIDEGYNMLAQEMVRQCF